MKKKQIFFAFLTCSLFFAYYPDSTVFAKEIKWRPVEKRTSIENFENEEGKKIFIHFYTKWCGYCTDMSENTFKDPQVISYINKNYIPIRVDNDKERIDGIAVSGVPNTWFLTEKGEMIGYQPGFINAESILAILKYMHTDSYLTMNFKEFLKTM